MSQLKPRGGGTKVGETGVEQMCPPPLLEASTPSCKRRSWMPTCAGTLLWLGRLQSGLFPGGARGKAATARMAEAHHRSLPRQRG